jgi:protein-S-isoprenylcysteine O-methyltransferase Ste14
MPMSLLYRYLFPAMWVSYSAYWWAMSRNVKETERQEPASSRITRLILIICAFALLWLPRVPLRLLNGRFLPDGVWCFWSGAAITAAGLLFSVWARRHLGKNWSQAVTLKEDHELITTGPYALVRHPIYTGLLLGFIGCAVARGEWRGLLAVALVFVALWRKLRLEEEWMRAQFGVSYEAYSRQVAALVPYLI